MRKIINDFKKPILALIIIVLLVFSISCSSSTAQTATLSPSSTPAASLTASPTTSTQPSVSASTVVSPTFSPTAPTATNSAIVPNWNPPVLSEASLPADLSGIVSQVLPRVVSINVQVASANFFNQPTTQQGAGSGWIIDSNGLIVTNNHVVQGAETLYDLVEISAPINPGNSGGPLIDSLGEVVGITNAKIVASGIEAVGYAISTKSALPIIQQLVQTGQIVRPFVGVSLQDVDATIASLYGLAVNQGALVVQVAANSPASTAGLQPGDVIVAVNNQTVANSTDAVQIIRASQVGQQVTITYYRGNTKSNAQVTLTQAPAA